MRIQCAYCREIINDRERIQVDYRKLGRLKIYENYHLNCYEKLKSHFLNKDIMRNQLPEDNLARFGLDERGDNCQPTSSHVSNGRAVTHTESQVGCVLKKGASVATEDESKNLECLNTSSSASVAIKKVKK